MNPCENYEDGKMCGKCAGCMSMHLSQAIAERDEARRLLGEALRGGEGRAGKLRLLLFKMRDAREVTAAAGFVLKAEAKAKLYDIQQDIIRSAIAADDIVLQQAADKALEATQTATPSPQGTR